jgi:lysozyme family protein
MPIPNPIIDFILRHEGGYVNDRDDPGGETNFGISKRSYPHLDIKNLTRKQAAEIYERDFYNKVRGDDLPVWLALMVTDFSVNAGIKPAVAILQRLVNETDDGIIGKKTIAACKSKPSRTLRQAYTTSREAYYDALAARRPAMKKFLNGWKMRTKDCDSLATFLDLHP